MKKVAILVSSMWLVAMLFWVTAWSQEDIVVLDDSAFENSQRPPSVFVHEEHNEAAEIEDCNACHHVYDDEGNLVEDESSEDQLCSDCHGLEADGRQPGLMKAYHMNCKGCHLDQKKGPIMCGECHQKG